MSLQTDRYPLLIANWTEALVRAHPLPGTAAERWLYRATLVTILVQQLRISLTAAGDPAPWKRFAVRCSCNAPPELEFTAGWARLAVSIVPAGSRGQRLAPADLAFWREFVPATIPMLARLCQAVDGSLLAAEWHLPEAPPPCLQPEANAGAVSTAASSRTAYLALTIPAAPTLADCVAEPAAPLPERPVSPRRRPRHAPPRSLAVGTTLIDPDVPSLRFSGRWLARLGFTPGHRAAVAAEPGRIVLTLDDAAGGAAQDA
jgi:Toxin SymE, type I toxin-antitoxin system